MIRYLLLAILVLVIARAFWRLVDGIIEAAGGTTKRSASAPRPVKLVRDPVCGTWVPTGSHLAIVAGSTTHHFCSERCRDAFSSGQATARSS